MHMYVYIKRDYVCVYMCACMVAIVLTCVVCNMYMHGQLGLGRT